MNHRKRDSCGGITLGVSQCCVRCCANSVTLSGDPVKHCRRTLDPEPSWDTWKRSIGWSVRRLRNAGVNVSIYRPQQQHGVQAALTALVFYTGVLHLLHMFKYSGSWCSRYISVLGYRKNFNQIKAEWGQGTGCEHLYPQPFQSQYFEQLEGPFTET